MKKRIALSFVALASVALLAACGEVKSGGSNATGTKVADKTIKIGFNFEETGATAAYGTAEQKGAQLAVEEINKAGGIDGKN
ncbi:conserved domain protein [Streptococcus constellatus subsp. pharyngis SK1060 = CCUG 46377]|uniref:Conserved domain protein n=1 Tax=Streptococcus constellatus subsp. pharyngis SK1060 = CCUG 46377 TaxID=1035184 RepID=F9P4R7_STRCV|nr:conserved domain protein [Streptococcus constellatus subsp. pharyngis SK1060 = CCUG 46377]